jgi:hypothetical protein
MPRRVRHRRVAQVVPSEEQSPDAITLTRTRAS